MGLTKVLEKKFSDKSKPKNEAYKARQEAEKLRFRQEQYEAEEHAYRKEKLRHAARRGRERAAGKSGVMGVFDTLGKASARMEEGMNRMEKTFFGSGLGLGLEPPHKPKRKKRR